MESNRATQEKYRDTITRFFVDKSNDRRGIPLYLWVRSQEANIGAIVCRWTPARVLTYDATTRAWSFDLAKSSPGIDPRSIMAILSPWYAPRPNGNVNFTDYLDGLLSFGKFYLPDGFSDARQAMQTFIRYSQDRIKQGLHPEPERAQQAIDCILRGLPRVGPKRRQEIRLDTEVRKHIAEAKAKRKNLKLDNIEQWPDGDHQEMLDKNLRDQHAQAIPRDLDTEITNQAKYITSMSAVLANVQDPKVRETLQSSMHYAQTRLTRLLEEKSQEHATEKN